MDSNDWTAIFTLGLLLVDILALVWNYKNKKYPLLALAVTSLT